MRRRVSTWSKIANAIAGPEREFVALLPRGQGKTTLLSAIGRMGLKIPLDLDYQDLQVRTFQVANADVDLVLLDITMPEVDGLGLLAISRRLAQEFPRTHAGWTLGSISRWRVSPSLPQVERVWNLVPSVISTVIM